MFPWGQPHSESVPPHAVGSKLYSGASRGTVVSVDADAGTVSVEWDDGKGKYGPITYPADADYLRKALPWES